MKILAIETTDPLGGVAAMCDGEIVAARDLDPAQRNAQSLAPAIKMLLADIAWRSSDVDLVAVSLGPGSFTGLRVGVTTAKTLAFTCGAEIMGVGTLETIAAAAPAGVERLTVAIDAQRNELVVQTFQMQQAASPFQLIDAELWLSTLAPGDFVAGPVLKKLLPLLPAGVTALPPDCWRATAANVARLAARDYALGRRDDLWKLLPIYSRKSAAEEKWEKNKRADA